MNLLVPTDFSEIANSALQYGAMLAKKLNAKILLFHTIPHHTIWWFSANNEMVAVAKKKQQAIKDLFVKLGVDEGKIELHVFYQFPLNIWINNFIKKNKIDFIVIGTKGEGGLKNSMMGSFTMGMIEHVSIPVIAVPPEANVNHINQILYPTDLKDTTKEVKSLISFAKALGASLHIVHVTSPGMVDILADDMMIKKIALKAGFEQITTDVKASYNVAAVIEESIREKNVDLLAMFPRERGFFKRLFTGSLTQEMSLQLTIPLLIIKTR